MSLATSSGADTHERLARARGGAAWRFTAAVCSLVVAAPAAAQARTVWQSSVGVGLARAQLRGGGSTGAVHARFMVVRDMNQQVGALVSFDAYGMGAGEAIPGCAPGAGRCEARTTIPSLVLGTSAGVVTHPVGDAISLLGSIGGFVGPGMKGDQPKSTLAFAAGADLELLARSRVTPVIGIRFVYFSRPLADVRSIVGPAAAVAF